MESLDAHPLVREFFGEKMEQEQAEAFHQAHSVLYDYYRNLPEKDLPDTLEEMEPLFAAVMHGCRAGRRQEVLVEVFWERIRRKTEGYSILNLGAFGSDLTALTWFFDQLWDRPSTTLIEYWQAAILSWAGFGLRALGRLGEAAQPMMACQEITVRKKYWVNAAANASNLSGFTLLLVKRQKPFALAANVWSMPTEAEMGLKWRVNVLPTPMLSSCRCQ